ncbi:MAG: heavy-metal-associated domain-containing protein [Prevotella sp.]|nr:heavy-metal-associated domain-containing protein [Prevotella sp.]
MKRIIVTLMAILTICMAQAKVVNTTIQLKNMQSKQKVERVAKQLKGVTSAVYSSKNKTLYISYDNKKTSASKIKTSLKNAGYKITSSQRSNGNNQSRNNHQNHQNTNQNSTKPTSHGNSSTSGSHQSSSGQHHNNNRK